MAKGSGNPFFDIDFPKMLSEFKVPGIDVEALLAAQRRNIEAMTAANQTAIEGTQAVMRRQAEIIRQTMEEVSATLTEMMSPGAPEEKVAKQAELAKSAFEHALANARELAELMAKANAETAEIINKRVSESLEEVKSLLEKAKK